MQVRHTHIIAHNNKYLKYYNAAKNLRLRYQLFIISRSIRTHHYAKFDAWYNFFPGCNQKFIPLV